MICKIKFRKEKKGGYYSILVVWYILITKIVIFRNFEFYRLLFFEKDFDSAAGLTASGDFNRFILYLFEQQKKKKSKKQRSTQQE